MKPLESFHWALATIQARFPQLVATEIANHPHLEAMAELPIQQALSLPIQLNLQNGDELHLVASNLWVEWFPCTDSKKAQAFVDAVIGLISGELEIEELFLFGRPVRARLRRREAKGQCLARWSNLLNLVPLPKTRRVVSNKSAA